MTPVNRQTINAVLRRYPVTVAYLFGSQARGDTGPLSDIDIGIKLKPGFKQDLFDLRLELMGKLSAALGRRDVDVIILDDQRVPLLLKYNVIQDGKLLMSSDETVRIASEYETMRHFFDFIYYEDLFGKLLRKQILTEKI